jgi:hypothetical protein
MQRTLLAVSMFLLSTGLAFAGPHDHHEGGPVVRDHRGGGGGPVVRDHRTYGGGGAVVRNGGPVVRDHRAYGGRGPVVRDHRSGPIHVANGRYAFPGGVVRTYHAPVIREHYYSYWRRPALIVESYEPVPGYMWTRGTWRWSGAEWVWGPGYWAVDPSWHVGVSVGASVEVE